MNNKEHFFKQRSPEWFSHRLGRFTASPAGRLVAVPSGTITATGLLAYEKLLAKDKLTEAEKKKLANYEIGVTARDTTLSSGAESYVLEKVVELVTGEDPNVLAFGAIKACEWGNDWEDTAICRYEEETFSNVRECGFFDIGNYAGGSPDGIVEDGVKIIEVKCPFYIVNHFKNLLMETVEDFRALHEDYYWQCQQNMLATGAESCDFVSFSAHPNCPYELRIKILEIPRNEADIKWLENRLDLAAQRKEFILSQLELI